MSRRAIVFLTALSAIGVTAAAQAQPPKQPTSPVVAMSSAGGISKGSYLAGVDWVVSEFLRRQRSEEFRKELATLVRHAGPDRMGLELPPVLQFGSATGASAGNINAVFAALGWCTERLTIDGRQDSYIPAEESLFWRTWVNTGAAQLLPRETNSEAAALSRQFIELHHKATIRDYLNRAVPSEGCVVPVGITLTKITPVTVPIEGSAGSIGIQRFAAVLTVQTVGSANPPYLDFARPKSTGKRLGALALLPQLGTESSEARDIHLQDVFEVMLASSAFPVAFAPRCLYYQPAGLARDELQPAGVAPQNENYPRPCELFSDGGVFDNNPIGLAIGLIENESGSPPVRVAYSSAYSYRGNFANSRAAISEPSGHNGLSAARKLLEGAFSSARDYELQSFKRQVERDRDVHKNITGPRIMPSTRRSPIVGETLHSFGAFLGRAFREYDFYTGVYDGLESIARNLLCEPRRTGEDAIRTCTSDVQVRLVTDNLMALGLEARTVAQWHLGTEYPRASMAPPATQPTAGLTLLRKIHDSLTKKRAPVTCQDAADPIEQWLCPGGLGELLDDLSSDRLVGDAADALLAACDLKPGGANERGECTVDPMFRALIRQPRREIYSLIRRALRNLTRGEDMVEDGGGKAMPNPGKVAYSLFRSATMRYRDGNLGPFDINRSSSAPDPSALPATIAGFVLPNYLHNIMLPDRPDQAAFGWQPVSLVLSDRVFVSSQLEIFLSQIEASTFFSKGLADHTGWGVSVGTYAVPSRLRLPVLGRPTSLEVGAFRLPKSFPAELRSADRYTFRASTRWISDKLVLNVLASRELRSVSFGISDLNGIVFWLLR